MQASDSVPDPVASRHFRFKHGIDGWLWNESNPVAIASLPASPHRPQAPVN
jgi:hypothetical protein